MADNERFSKTLLRRGPGRGGGVQHQGRVGQIDLPDGYGQWRGLRRSGLGAVLLVILGILCGVGASGDAAQESQNETSPVRSNAGDTDRMTPSVLPTASDFCARTLPIWYWILKAIPDVSDCADVTAEHLATVTSLDLSRRDLSRLKPGDFAGLNRLETLRLDNNRLTTLPPEAFAGLGRLKTLRLDNNRLRILPERVFAGLGHMRTLQLDGNDLTTLPVGMFVGLDRLQTLLLDRNPGAPFGFIPTVERIGEDDVPDGQRIKVRVRLAQGAPFPMRVTWKTGAGGRAPRTGRVMIPAGQMVSEPFAVAGQVADVTLSNLEFMGITEEFSDDTGLITGLMLQGLRANNICGRTEQVQDALMKSAGVLKCADVKADYWATVTDLDLSNLGISDLKPGDFAGLYRVKTLKLDGNDLTTLPAGVFGGLDHLRTLELTDNRLTTLPSRVFAGLDRLRTLKLDGNDLTTLPAGVFVGLDRLQALLLGGNPGTPFRFIPKVERIGEGDGPDDQRIKMRVRLAQGAPFPIRVTWKTGAGGRAPRTGRVMIPAGQMVSEPFAVAGRVADVTLTNLKFMGITEEFSDDTGLITGLMLQGLRANNICGRTEQVQDALMKSAGVLKCADVKADYWATVTDLDLSNLGISDLKPGDFAGLYRVKTLKLDGNDLTTLPAGVFGGLDHLRTLELTDNRLTTLPSRVFAGLDRLRTLKLDGNDLTTLPAGVFVGLDRLQALLLGGNPGTPFRFIPKVERIGEGDGPDDQRIKMRVRLAQGAPFPIRVTWKTGAGGRAPRTGRVMIPAGQMVSEPFAVAGRVADVTLTNLKFMGITEEFSDDTGLITGLMLQGLRANNICGRTEQVQDALMKSAGVLKCADVKADYWATVTDLDLSNLGISDLKPGDFAGLYRVKTLKLDGNDLTTLPAGVFGGLDHLRTLELTDNRLTTLPSRVFASLDRLRTLKLDGNDLTTLPAGVFVGLDRLQALLLGGNPGTPFRFIPKVERIGEGDGPDDQRIKMRVRLAQGAPFPIRVTWKTGAGGRAPRTGRVMIPAGQMVSEPFAVAGRVADVTLTNLKFMGITEEFSDDTGLITGLMLQGLRANNICGRTEQVQDALMKSAGVLKCADVKADYWATVTDLDLSNLGISDLKPGDFAGLYRVKTLKLDGNDLTTLPAGVFGGLDHLRTLELTDNRLTTLPSRVFAGLDRLRTLKLDGNDLTTLPAGVFVGLDRLQALLLGGNPGTPFRFIPKVERIGEGDGPDDQRIKMRVRLAQGAPFPIRVTWKTGAGGRAPRTGRVMIPAGQMVSEPFAVAGRVADVTLTNLKFMGITEEFSDDTGLITGLMLQGLRANNICGRTEQVQDALMKSAGVLKCADVKADYWATVTDLDLSNLGISDLKPGDFAGLYRVKTLKLDGNDLTTLPAGVFGGLDRLRTLGLADNRLTTLPAGVFGGLDLLRTLKLDENDLTTLPAGVFGGLDRLRKLRLEGNDLVTLPAGVFGGLDHLQILRLDDNDLTTLPAGVFVGLDHLRKLGLANNRLTALPSGVFVGLSLQVLLLDGNPGTPFRFIPTVERIGEGDGPDDQRIKVRVRLAQGAPFPMRVTWTTGAGGRASQTGRVMIPAGQMESESFAVAGHVADMTLSNPEFMGITEEFSDNRGWVAGRWGETHSPTSILSKKLLELLNRGKTQNHGAFRERPE